MLGGLQAGCGGTPEAIAPPTTQAVVQKSLPTLHGLCVVTDFVDARLEDYSGPGYRSIPDIESQLAKMSDHWRSMSVGAQSFTWAVMRIQLPVSLTPSAYGGWWSFREDVITRVRAQLGGDVAKYDGDGDGVMDAVWIIPAAKSLDYPYLGGGASRNAGAGVFVDSQGTLSAQVGATGNFNHEVGHLRGLPDIYGKHDAVRSLSLMSNSWYNPPILFSGVDRLWLDWLDVKEVRADATVTLRPAETHLEAVLIPAVDPYEYVLIEYRRKPTSGYGSNSDIPQHDGLAIYHVLETAESNARVPPLVRLELADGVLGDEDQPDATDLWSPENRLMPDAYRGQSYYSGEQFVVVQNIVRVAGGIRFDVHAKPLIPSSGQNMLTNPGLDANAEGWSPGGWRPGAASFQWEAGAGRGGGGCMSITATSGVHAAWEQKVSGLIQGASYEFRGWVKGQDVRAVDPPDGSQGAGLSVEGPSLGTSPVGEMGTFDWKPFAIAFTAAESGPATVSARLGFYARLMAGKAWFDDLSLVRLSNAKGAATSAHAAVPIAIAHTAAGSGRLPVDDDASRRPTLPPRAGRRLAPTW